MPALVCRDTAQAAVSTSNPIGILTLHHLSDPYPSSQLTALLCLGSRLPRLHKPIWRRTSAAILTGIAMGPGATLQTLGPLLTTVLCDAAVRLAMVPCKPSSAPTAEGSAP